MESKITEMESPHIWIQLYNSTEYRSGKVNVKADTLSRLPWRTTTLLSSCQIGAIQCPCTYKQGTKTPKQKETSADPHIQHVPQPKDSNPISGTMAREQLLTNVMEREAVNAIEEEEQREPKDENNEELDIPQTKYHEASPVKKATESRTATTIPISMTQFQGWQWQDDELQDIILVLEAKKVSLKERKLVSIYMVDEGLLYHLVPPTEEHLLGCSW